MELPHFSWFFLIIKVTSFLRAPLLLNFQILCYKMSQFLWKEHQNPLLLQPAFLHLGQKLCTTAAKIVAHFSSSGILTSQGCWAEVVTSGILSLPLSAWNPSPYEQAGTKLIMTPVFLDCHGWNRFSTLQVGAG